MTADSGPSRAVGRRVRAAGALLAAAMLATALGLAGCGDDRSAERLWRDYCGRCHGRRGEGLLGADGRRQGLDLTASRMVAEGRRDEIASLIARGKGRMPGFAHRLDADEIDRLVDFVLTLAPPAEPEPEGP